MFDDPPAPAAREELGLETCDPAARLLQKCVNYEMHDDYTAIDEPDLCARWSGNSGSIAASDTSGIRVGLLCKYEYVTKTVRLSSPLLYETERKPRIELRRESVCWHNTRQCVTV